MYTLYNRFELTQSLLNGSVQFSVGDVDGDRMTEDGHNK